MQLSNNHDPGSGLRAGLVDSFLHQPIQYAENATKKKLRAKAIGFMMEIGKEEGAAGDADWNLRTFSAAIEDIHLGSLIVDDIQDGSRVRREKPALHRVYGLPIALNAGNYLYFKALNSLFGLRIPRQKISLLQNLLISAMKDAHEGQAIDLGVEADSVPQEEMAEVSDLSARLKTGALVRAAFGGGLLLGKSNEKNLDAVLSFGEAWGACLQKLDDYRHYRLSLSGELPEGKAFEDFFLGRPTWIWASASARLSPREYHLFRSAALREPAGELLQELLLESGLLDEALELEKIKIASAAQSLAEALGLPPSKKQSLDLLTENLFSSFLIPAPAEPLKKLQMVENS